MTSQTQRAPKRVFVLRFSSLGDIVLTAPVLEALKGAWPETRIIFGVKEQFTHLVAHNPHVDKVIGLKKNESLWRYRNRLNVGPSDAILDLHGKLRSRALLLTANTQRRARWQKRPLRDQLPVRLGLRNYRPDTTIAQRYHQAAERLVGQNLAPGKLRYFVPPTARREAGEILRQAGLHPEHSIVAMCPGAKWATKQWPIERYAALAMRLLDNGHRVLVTGSPNETHLAQIIRHQVPDVVTLFDEIPIRLLGATLDHCQAVVANDSGPMHIARALGIPTLAFFGPTAPEMFEFNGHTALSTDIACSPCHFYGRPSCPQKHFSCMLDIQTDEAWNHLQPLLGSGRRAFLHA